MGYLRAITRLIFFFFIVIGILTYLPLTEFFVKGGLGRGLRVRRKFVIALLWGLGVRVQVKGKLTTEPAIYISNHRSYIDPTILLKDVLAVPVAKSEVSQWPLIGKAIETSGILFVVRDKKESRRQTRKAVTELWQQGFSTLIYPEGTTHIQPTTIEFHKGIFMTAAEEGLPIIPVALEFANKDDAWVGDDTFIPHFLRCFSKKETLVQIRYGLPISSNNMDDLVAQTQSWIDKNLASIQAELGLHL